MAAETTVGFHVDVAVANVASGSPAPAVVTDPDTSVTVSATAKPQRNRIIVHPRTQ